MDETVLVAVVGISPAILTETVWALAHEKMPIIPDKIVVLTTTTGKSCLERELFAYAKEQATGWKRLVSSLSDEGFNVEGKLQFGLADYHVRLFPSKNRMRNVEDITSFEDNAAAADMILDTLRGFTEQPNTRVLASIAGGRKTMGALMMSCMSLLGREQDRVLHVLVNPPFDSPLSPPFLFPEMKVKYHARDGNAVKEKPKVDLVDVPYVRMRGWYESIFKSPPPSYIALVKGIQKEMPLATNYPELCFDCSNGVLVVQKNANVELSPMEFVVTLLLQRGISSLESLKQALASINPTITAKAPDWIIQLLESSRFKSKDPMDISKVLSSARAKLARHPALKECAEALIPKRGKPSAYPVKRIHYKQLELLRISADI